MTAALLSQSLLSQAAAISPAPTHQWGFELAGSVAFLDTPSISEGSTDETTPLVTGLNTSNNYTTFSPRIGIWFPVSNMQGFDVSAMANISYVTINSITAYQAGNTSAERGALKLRGKKINYAVALEAAHPMQQNYFSALRLGGGISQQDYYYSSIGEDAPVGTDKESGNMSVFLPFFSVQAGIGKKFSANTSVQVFARFEQLYNTSDTPRMASNGDDETYVVFNPAKSMVSVGVSVTC